MDCKKVGTLLLGLRKEKGLPQKQVANKLNAVIKQYLNGKGDWDARIYPC